MNKWPVEEIPDGDVLYHRVHRNALRNMPADMPKNKVYPNAFRIDDGDMSVDWSKYATPQEAKNRAKVPAQNGIVEFTAGDVRDDGHRVVHSPSRHNQAHSSVRGPKARLRTTLSRAAQWTIQIT